MEHTSRLLGELSAPRPGDQHDELKPDPYKPLRDLFAAKLKLEEGQTLLEIQNSGEHGSWSTFLTEVYCLGCERPLA